MVENFTYLIQSYSKSSERSRQDFLFALKEEKHPLKMTWPFITRGTAKIFDDRFEQDLRTML